MGQNEALAAPNPQDWREHIALAFRGRSEPKFAPSEPDFLESLLVLTPEPPVSLLAFLQATNGLYDNDERYGILFKISEIVRVTLEGRTESETLESLLVVGGPGLDGIRFVMDCGARSDGVGIYYPAADEVLAWPSPSLWQFVQSWGERTLTF